MIRPANSPKIVSAPGELYSFYTHARAPAFGRYTYYVSPNALCSATYYISCGLYTVSYTRFARDDPVCVFEELIH